MAAIFLTICLALTGSAIAAPSLLSSRQSEASTSSNATLAPVVIVSDDATTFAPSSNVSLPYGSQLTDRLFVNVNLTTISPSILLESFSTIALVDCASDSISVVFDNANDLMTAYSEWSIHSVLTFITNNMGDCDSEFERGFFTADSFTTDASTLTLVVSTQKSSINDVACKFW